LKNHVKSKIEKVIEEQLQHDASVEDIVWGVKQISLKYDKLRAFSLEIETAIKIVKQVHHLTMAANDTVTFQDHLNIENEIQKTFEQIHVALKDREKKLLKEVKDIESRNGMS
jgi:hypothetical protein